MKIRLYTIFTKEIAVVVEICLSSPQTHTKREYSSKPLKHSSAKRILVFKR